jgi:hypothetical protein
MPDQPQTFKIKVTTADGREIFWHKQGQVYLLPTELADTWIAKFKPQFFEITESGEMVGAGRNPAVASFKIAKVEKVPT